MTSNLIKWVHHLTKYPSIENYHSAGKLSCEFNQGEYVFITEKIDGTNVRLINLVRNGSVCDFFIGSRQEILYAQGDRNWISTLNIVDDITEKNYLQALKQVKVDQSAGEYLRVIYGELYGGSIGKFARQYSTDESKTEFRVFDMATIKVPPEFILGHPCDPLVTRVYREANLRFVPIMNLSFQVPSLKMAPIVDCTEGFNIPKDPFETKGWLSKIIPVTQCDITLGAGMKPEGVVLRNSDRSKIAKVRFDDYRKIKE